MRLYLPRRPNVAQSPGAGRQQPGRRMQAAFVVGEVEVSQFCDEMIGNCPPLLSEQLP